MGAQDGTTRLLIIAAAAAAGWYMFGSQIQAALPDLTRNLGHYIGPTMRLDPTAPPGDVEDRRGERGGDLGRQLGPPPQWGPAGGGGMPPWGEARGEAPEDPGRYPRDPQERPYRRWRDCTGSRSHPRCGPWHDGPAPGDR